MWDFGLTIKLWPGCFQMALGQSTVYPTVVHCPSQLIDDWLGQSMSNMLWNFNLPSPWITRTFVSLWSRIWSNMQMSCTNWVVMIDWPVSIVLITLLLPNSACVRKYFLPGTDPRSAGGWCSLVGFTNMRPLKTRALLGRCGDAIQEKFLRI